MKKIILYPYILLNIILVLFFWYNNSNYLLTSTEPGSLLIAFGRLTGLFTELFILAQLLLVSRFTFIEKEFGLDKLINLHKTIGLSLGIFIISHPLLLTLGYAKSNNIGIIKQFFSFQQNWEDVFTATIAFFIIILIAVISTKKIRSKISYEVWYFAHLPLYIAIAIAFGHQLNTASVSTGPALFYWYFINLIVFGIFIAYRFLRPAYSNFKHSFNIEKIVLESKNVYSIYITGKNIDDFMFKEGQYATLIFLQKGMWFHHPFSFSDAYNGKYLRFTIKSSGDFTSKINSLKIGTKVWIDGPVGTFTLEKSINSKYLFIAGGIGITPILSILKSISDNAILLYSNKSEDEINFKNEILQNGIETHYFNTTNDGRIDINKVKELCSDYKERDIYICGPSQMTNDLVKQIKEKGVPNAQIHFEKFSY